MRLSRRREPFDHADGIFQLKLDGFRALAYLENGEGRLVSRNGNTFASFRDLAASVAASFRGTDAVLDGAIVCLDEHGCPQFEDLMFRRGQLFFIAFDALWINGEDLRNLPLLERKRRLRRVVPRGNVHRTVCGTWITSKPMAVNCIVWRARGTLKQSWRSTEGSL